MASPSTISISPGAGKDMSAFSIAGGSVQRQTVIVGDADRSGEADLAELPNHGEEDRGNPLKIGGRASASPFADVAEGDRTDAWFTTNGQLGTINVVEPTVVYDGGRRELVQIFVSYSSPLTTATIVPGVANMQTKVMGITATINGPGPGTLYLSDGTNRLLVVDHFTVTLITRRMGYGPHMLCQTPVNTGLVLEFVGTPTQFYVSLLYYQA